MTHTATLSNQHVFTYTRQQWPQGVITGYEDGDGGLVVEHVIAFRPGVLRGLVRAGLAESWALGFRYLLFRLPHRFPLTKKLVRLLRRLGAAPYYTTEYETYFVLYRGGPRC
jgi:hypothetical protein